MVRRDLFERRLGKSVRFSPSAEIPSASQYTTRILGLDGIRGIAVLLVMFHHFALYGWPTRPDGNYELLFKRIILSGWIGVDLFFILSGFLITGILLRTKSGKHFFRNFYIGRMLRIFPLYYGFLVIVFILIPSFFPIGGAFSLFLEDRAWYWTYLVNIKYGIWGVSEYFAFAHFWSLAIEEQFYLIWPAVVYLFRRELLIAICVLIIIGGLVFRLLFADGGFQAPYILTPARMDVLAIGCLLAVIIQSQDVAKRLFHWAWPVLGISGFAIALIFYQALRLVVEDYYVKTFGISLIGIFFGALLILAVAYPADHSLGKVLSSRGFRFFGRYSYGLYVFHHLVAIYLPRLGFSAESISTIFESQWISFIFFCLNSTVISLGFALISWHFWESRFLSLKNKFAYE